MPDITPSLPAPYAFPIVPNDTLPCTREAYSHLYVGGLGDIVIRNADGSLATLTAVPVGVLRDFAPSTIHATGTTATLLVGLKGVK